MGPALAGMRVPGGGSIGFAGGSAGADQQRRPMTDPKKHPEAVRLGRKGGNAKAAKNNGVPRDGMHSAPPHT